MIERIRKSWEQFIYKNLINPEYVRKDVFQSWLRSRYYNINPYLELNNAVLLDEKSICHDWIRPLLDTTTYGIYLINSSYDVVDAFYNENIEIDPKLQIKSFKETYIGTTAAALINDKSPVSYATRYEHYINAFHAYDTVCINLSDIEDSEWKEAYKDCTAMVLLCKDYILKLNSFDSIKAAILELFKSRNSCAEEHYLKGTSYTKDVPRLSNEVTLNTVQEARIKISNCDVYHLLNELTGRISTDVKVNIIFVAEKGEISQVMLDVIHGAINDNFLIVIASNHENALHMLNVPGNCFIVLLELQPLIEDQQTINKRENKLHVYQHEDESQLAALVHACHSYFIGYSILVKRDEIMRGKSQLIMEIDSATTGSLKDIEKRAIISSLIKSKGSKSAAAVELGISRTTLYRKLQEYDLDLESWEK